MPVNPRARTIINHCQRPGAFLRAAHVKYGSGRALAGIAVPTTP